MVKMVIVTIYGFRRTEYFFGEMKKGIRSRLCSIERLGLEAAGIKIYVILDGCDDHDEKEGIVATVLSPELSDTNNVWEGARNEVKGCIADVLAEYLRDNFHDEPDPVVTIIPSDDIPVSASVGSSTIR